MLLRPLFAVHDGVALAESFRVYPCSRAFALHQYFQQWGSLVAASVLPRRIGPGPTGPERCPRKRIGPTPSPKPQHLGLALLERGVAAVFAALGIGRTPASTGSTDIGCGQRHYGQRD